MESLSSFIRCERVFCPNMLFRRRLLRRLTSPRGRKYIASVVKRGDSSPRAEIHRAAEKGKSYLLPSFNRLVLITVIGLILAAVYFFGVRKDMSDFGVCYKAGRRIIAGETLYRASDGHLQFKYSPASAIFFALLSLLPYGPAKLAWYILEFVCLAGVFVLSARIFGIEKKTAAALFAWTFLVLLKFLAREIELGQVNLFILVLLTLMLNFLIKEREMGAGLSWGISLFFKPYVLVFLPYLVFKKKLKAVAFGLGLLGVGLAVPALFFGFQGNLAVLKEWPTTLSLSTPRLLGVYDNASLSGFLLKMFSGMPNSILMVALVLSVLIIAAVMLEMMKRGRSGPAPEIPEALEGAFLLVLIPFLSPLGWYYNYLYSWLAVMLIIRFFRKLPTAWKIIQVINFAVIGSSLVEIWGWTLFRFYTQHSLVVVNYLIVLATLFYFRAKRIA